MISGARIKGRGFVEATNLTFFEDSDQRIAVVFGRNGSGKTTVGEGFAQYSSSLQITDQVAENDDLSVKLLAKGTREEEVPPQAGAETLVFNEQFIEHNVRISDDGIRSLVLFGEQGEHQDGLDETITRRDAAQKELDLATAALDQANTSHDKQRELALADLRGGWADRERVIKGNKQNSPVNGALLDEFIRMPTPSADFLEAQARITDLTQQLTRSRGAEELSEEVPNLDVESWVQKFDTAIFGRTITPPTGAGLAGLVAQAIEEHGTYVQQAHSAFSREGVKTCPLCLQVVSTEHREGLLVAIEAAVDQPAKDFSAELQLRRIVKLDLQLDQEVENLNQSRARSVSLLVEKFNVAVERWNEAIEGKAARLYSSYSVDFSDALGVIREIDRELQQLVLEREKWNGAVKGFKNLTREALNLNKIVSRVMLQAKIDACVSAKTAVSELEERIESASLELNETEGAVLEMQKKLKSEDVAAEEINKSLSIVFADPTRLRLVAGEAGENSGKFLLQIRGRSVKPHRLSAGERNVLALCYFFTLLKQSVDNGMKPNTGLLVLDDPISSVDTDCRIGILGFIESQVTAWLNLAPGAKALFFTHDVGVFQDLGKTAKAVLEELPSRAQGSWNVAAWVMRNTGSEEKIQIQLVHLEGKFDEPLHEYKALLEFVFEYARSGTTQPDSDVTAIGVGNALRRVFEAFGVFIYNQRSITASPIAAAYAELGRGALAQPIRQTLVSVLHGGSHHKDRMMMLGDFTPGSWVGHEEKVTAIRRILALMYALQPQHMKRYLSDASAVELEDWKASLL